MTPFLIPAALNHLLNQEQWARDKLMPHQGKVACFDAGLLPLKLKVAGDGLLQAAGADDPADVTIRAALADLPLIARDPARAFAHVKIEGDADFANAISQVSQSLRWEVEEDLARLVGDAAAARMAGTARQMFSAMQSLQRKFAENAAEYLLEENPTLVRAQQVDAFVADVTRLRDDADRLAKRIDRLADGKGERA